MLAMGRALMGKPRLLMLDEPSLGLAPLIVREIFSIIAGLRATGVSILLVEQNARAALQVADYGYVLETGELAIEGPSAELAANPRVAATYLGKAAGDGVAGGAGPRTRRALGGPAARGSGGFPCCDGRVAAGCRGRLPADRGTFDNGGFLTRTGLPPAHLPRLTVTDLSLPPVGAALVAEARRLLLDPAQLDDAHLSRVLASIHTHEVDFADLYFQYSRVESWSLEEGIVKSGAFSIDRGVGVRAVHGERQAFAYSDDISLAALEEAAVAARAIGRQGQVCGRAGRAASARARSLYLPQDPVVSLSEAAKVALLERLEQKARALDRRVVQVMASIAGEYEAILVARSDGLVAADVRPLVRVSLTVIVEEGGRREQGYAGGGGRFDYALLRRGDARPLRAGRRSTRRC